MIKLCDLVFKNYDNTIFTMRDRPTLFKKDTIFITSGKIMNCENITVVNNGMKYLDLVFDYEGQKIPIKNFVIYKDGCTNVYVSINKTILLLDTNKLILEEQDAG